MSSSVLGLTERVLDEAVEDTPIPCDILPADNCERPAEWWWICPTCGHADGVCEPHRAWFRRNRVLLRVLCTVRCLACKTETDPMRIKFERIGR